VLQDLAATQERLHSHLMDLERPSEVSPAHGRSASHDQGLDGPHSGVVNAIGESVEASGGPSTGPLSHRRGGRSRTFRLTSGVEFSRTRWPHTTQCPEK
jgi:hypothetical protein